MLAPEQTRRGSSDQAPTEGAGAQPFCTLGLRLHQHVKPAEIPIGVHGFEFQEIVLTEPIPEDLITALPILGEVPLASVLY